MTKLIDVFEAKKISIRRNDPSLSTEDLFVMIKHVAEKHGCGAFPSLSPNDDPNAFIKIYMPNGEGGSTMMRIMVRGLHAEFGFIYVLPIFKRSPLEDVLFERVIEFEDRMKFIVSLDKLIPHVIKMVKGIDDGVLEIEKEVKRRWPEFEVSMYVDHEAFPYKCVSVYTGPRHEYAFGFLIAISEDLRNYLYVPNMNEVALTKDMLVDAICHKLRSIYAG
jgi:hypothetical protein